MRLMYKKAGSSRRAVLKTPREDPEIIAVFYSVLELLKAGRVRFAATRKFDGSVDDGNIVLNSTIIKLLGVLKMTANEDILLKEEEKDEFENAEQPESLSCEEIKKALEAILFACGHPVTLKSSRKYSGFQGNR